MVLEKKSVGKNILIVGAGYIGAELATKLTLAGHQVWGVKRTDPDSVPSWTPIIGDLNAGLCLNFLPVLDEVYFLLAPGRSSSDSNRWEKTYVGGLKKVLCQGLQIGKLIYVSSTSTYGENAQGWVDENTPIQPTSLPGFALRQAESIIKQLSFPGIVVRFGGIYGRTRQRMLDQIKEGKARLTPEPLYTNRTYQKDCLGILLHMQNIANPAPVYLAVDSEPSTWNQVNKWLQKIIPNAPTLELMNEDEFAIARKRGNKKCSNALIKSTGYTFIAPNFREGYQDLLKDS